MLIANWFVFKYMFERKKASDPTAPKKQVNPEHKLMGPHFDQYVEYRNGFFEAFDRLPREKVTLQSFDGLSLNAYLLRCEKPCGRSVILVHGYSGSGITAWQDVALKYLEKGYNVLLPDNRACGESEGHWVTFGVLESLDIQKWAYYMAECFPSDSIIIHGASLGGATTCMMADKELPASVKALVPDCPYASINNQLKYMINYVGKLPSWPFMLELRFYFRHVIHRNFLHENPINCVRNARLPMLFIHGDADRYVPAENSRLLYEVCPTEKQLLMVSGRGHVAARVDEKLYYDTLFAFIERFA